MQRIPLQETLPRRDHKILDQKQEAQPWQCRAVAVVCGFMWARMGYAALFQAAGLINAFACVPLIVIMGRRDPISPTSADSQAE